MYNVVNIINSIKVALNKIKQIEKTKKNVGKNVDDNVEEKKC